MSISIPIKDLAEEEIKIDIKNLPLDVNEIIQLLDSNLSNDVSMKLSKWLEFSFAYFNQGLYDQYEELMEKVTSMDVSTDMRAEFTSEENKDHYFRLLSSFAGYYLTMAVIQKDEKKQKDLLGKANMLLNKAEFVSPLNEQSFVNKGVIHLLEGDLGTAKTDFSSALAKMTAKDNNMQSALMGLGCSLYGMGKYQDALEHFQRVLKSNPDFIDVRRAIGMCYYQIKNYRLAELAFKRVMELDPNNTKNLINFSFIFLKEVDKDNTQKAFDLINRSIKLSKAQAKDLKKRGKHTQELGTPPPLGLHLFGEHFFIKGEYKKATVCFTNVYHHTTIKCLKAEALYYLAKIKHIEGNYEEAFKYYNTSGRLDPSYAPNTFRLAQMNIHRGEYDEAIKLFERILRNDAAFKDKPLDPADNEDWDLERGEKEFEYEYKKRGEVTNIPEESMMDIFKYLAILYFKIGQFRKSYLYTKRAWDIMEKHRLREEKKNEKSELMIVDTTPKYEEDEKLLLLMSLLSRDYKLCISCLLKLQDLYSRSANDRNENILVDDDEDVMDIDQGGDEDDKFGFELKNNLAVLYLMLNKESCLKESEKIFREILEKELGIIFEDVDDMDEEEEEKITFSTFFTSEKCALGMDVKFVHVVFNFAMLMERMKRNEDATMIYLWLIRNFPRYLDSYLRLAVMAKSQDKMVEAIKWCKLAANVDPSNPSGWILLGCMHLEREEWHFAQKRFETILQKIDDDNIFALLGLGCVYTSCSADEKKKNFLTYAAKLFNKVLTIDKFNVHATVSLASTLAQKGYLQSAKSILLKVKDVHMASYSGSSSGDSEDDSSRDSQGAGILAEVLVNLGHIAMCEKQYSLASKYFQMCSRRCFSGKNVDVLLFLAKALFSQHNLEACKDVLEQGLKVEPDNVKLLFNLAVSEHENCLKVLYEKKQSVQFASFVVKEVESSKKHFGRVVEILGGSKNRNKFENLLKKSKSFLVFIEDDTMKKALRNFEKAREIRAKVEKKRKLKTQEFEQRRIQMIELKKKTEREQMEKRTRKDVLDRIREVRSQKLRQFDERAGNVGESSRGGNDEGSSSESEDEGEEIIVAVEDGDGDGDDMEVTEEVAPSRERKRKRLTPAVDSLVEEEEEKKTVDVVIDKPSEVAVVEQKMETMPEKIIFEKKSSPGDDAVMTEKDGSPTNMEDDEEEFAFDDDEEDGSEEGPPQKKRKVVGGTK